MHWNLFLNTIHKGKKGSFLCWWLQVSDPQIHKQNCQPCVGYIIVAQPKLPSLRASWRTSDINPMRVDLPRRKLCGDLEMCLWQLSSQRLPFLTNLPSFLQIFHLTLTSLIWSGGQIFKNLFTFWPLFYILPAAHSAFAVFLRSCRNRRLLAWPALTRCGPATFSGCSCSYPAAAQQPRSPSASLPCGQRTRHVNFKGGLAYISLGAAKGLKPKSSWLSRLLAVWLWGGVYPPCVSVSSSIKRRWCKGTREI